MKFDYMMAVYKNGDRVTVELKEAQDLGLCLRTELDGKMDVLKTVSFHLQGKVVMSMTFFA